MAQPPWIIVPRDADFDLHLSKTVHPQHPGQQPPSPRVIGDAGRCVAASQQQPLAELLQHILHGGLRELAETFDPDRMDILLLLASTTASIGYEGRGDFIMAPDGRLSLDYRGPLPAHGAGSGSSPSPM